MADTERQSRVGLILAHEKHMAHQLALLVIDKPSPPFWMTFVPMFLIFYTQKFKEYARDVEAFMAGYIQPKQHALQAAFAEENVDLDALTGAAGCMPDQARAPYRRFLRILIDHYARLLASPGRTIEEMYRHGYEQENLYLLFCDNLDAAEEEYNLALLPQIDDDRDHVLRVIHKINASAATIRRQQCACFFLRTSPESD